MTSGLLDSETTIAVILGASDWSRAGLGKAKSFLKSAAYVQQYLLRNRPDGLGLDPDLVLSLFDDTAAASVQLARLRDFTREVVLDRRDTHKPIADILVYYIGHGTCDDGNTLYLLVRDTVHGIEAQSSIPTPDLARVLKVAAPQQRRICIFDCCFSEAAVAGFGAMGGLDEAVTKIGATNLVADSPSPQRGTMLLCSSPRGSSSIGLPNAERTLFTGALLRVLQRGSNNRNAMLSFLDLKEDVFEEMLQQHNGVAVPRPALHQPHQQDGDLTRLPAFPNVRALNKLTEEAKRKEDEQCAAETKRQQEKSIVAETERLEQERRVEAGRRHEEEGLAVERKHQEEARLAVEAKHQEEERLAVEAKHQEEERLAVEAKHQEEERLAVEAKHQEEERLAVEAKHQEEERLAVEAKRQADICQEAEAKPQEEELRETDVLRREKERLALAESCQQEERRAAVANREEERLATKAKHQREENLTAEAIRLTEERLGEAKRLEDEAATTHDNRPNKTQPSGEAMGQVAEGATTLWEEKLIEQRRRRLISMLVAFCLVIIVGYTINWLMRDPSPLPDESVSAASIAKKKSPLSPATSQMTLSTTLSNSPIKRWSGFTASIISCAYNDSAMNEASALLIAQGFDMPKSAVWTTRLSSDMAESSVLQYYDKALTDRVRKLSADLTEKLNTPIGYVDKSSKRPSHRVILILVGKDCSGPMSPGTTVPRLSTRGTTEKAVEIVPKPVPYVQDDLIVDVKAVRQQYIKAYCTTWKGKIMTCPGDTLDECKKNIFGLDCQPHHNEVHCYSSSGLVSSSCSLAIQECQGQLKRDRDFRAQMRDTFPKLSAACVSVSLN
jgi:hypothetical protein